MLSDETQLRHIRQSLSGRASRWPIPAADRDDIVQETLAALLASEKAATLKDEPLLRYAHAVLRNQLALFLRRRHRDRTLPEAYVATRPMAHLPPPIPEGPTLTEDLATRALALLSPLDRDILTRWSQGIPSAQIGADVGLSADAVRQRVTRAMNLLRHTLFGHSRPDTDQP